MSPTWILIDPKQQLVTFSAWRKINGEWHRYQHTFRAEELWGIQLEAHSLTMGRVRRFLINLLLPHTHRV